MNVFEFNDYVDVIKAFVQANKNVRGYQSRLSEAAGVHASFLSRALNGEVHLTPDQVAQLAQFWGLSEGESNYFLCLLNLERAGTVSLKRLIQIQITDLRERYNDLGAKLHMAKKMDAHQDNVYYSAWYYAAIHTLLGIEGFRTPESIAQKLRLPTLLVEDVLKTLEAKKLVCREGRKWISTEGNIHLSNQSWMARVHHANWRLKAIEALQIYDQQNVHYTGLHTLSLKDFVRIKNVLKSVLVDVDRIVRPSNNEEICYLGLDLYRL